MDAGVECTRRPQPTAEYGIYNAFYADPDGYAVEIQRWERDDWPGP